MGKSSIESINEAFSIAMLVYQRVGFLNYIMLKYTEALVPAEMFSLLINLHAHCPDLISPE